MTLLIGGDFECSFTDFVNSGTADCQLCADNIAEVACLPIGGITFIWCCEVKRIA